MSLAGSKTEGNLKDAFAGESQANRRYLYFAQKADVEGYNDVATVFRSTAEGETGLLRPAGAAAVVVVEVGRDAQRNAAGAARLGGAPGRRLQGRLRERHLFRVPVEVDAGVHPVRSGGVARDRSGTGLGGHDKQAEQKRAHSKQ